jgi:AcrR family transcriptional regulator
VQGQRRRADARRNSERVVRAVITLFRDRGPVVPLELVAEHAGVGIATVYRLFGGREGLVRAAFDTYFVEEVEPLAVAARGSADPGRGLADAMTAAVRSLAAHHDLLTAAHEAGAVTIDTAERFLGPLREVLRAAQDAGQVRGELVVRDLAAIVVMALATVHPSDPDGADVRRYLALLLAGIRAPGPALPPPACGGFGGVAGA